MKKEVRRSRWRGKVISSITTKSGLRSGRRRRRHYDYGRGNRLTKITLRQFSTLCLFGAGWDEVLQY
ncbi:unnamed protein product [Linum trigynum]|uniref:Ribosomal protein L20 n=1 Tax=Linum trigynum TaxID=586398 RepID=A0AAV2GLS8_9ROSI